MTNGRDARGRFARGAKPGPGRERGRKEHRQAMHDAVSPEDIAGIMRTLRDLALGGDVAAARVLLDRLLGKPREQQPDLRIQLPALDSAEQVAQAVRLVVQAVAAGQLPAADGRVIVDLLGAVLESGEVAHLLEQHEIPQPWRRD